MKKYFEVSLDSWQTHDWSSLVGTRLWHLLCKCRPSLIRLLGKGTESYSDEEWMPVASKLAALAAIQTCNEAFPFDSSGLETVEQWLLAAVEKKVVGETEGDRLVKMLYEHLT